MRRDGWTYWITGLPDDSPVLEDLQRLADELGGARGGRTGYFSSPIQRRFAARGAVCGIWSGSDGILSSPGWLPWRSGRNGGERGYRRTAVAAQEECRCSSRYRIRPG